jgi:hypothetical protein
MPPPLSDHERLLQTNAEARLRQESGEPWTPEQMYPPALNVSFDRAVSKDAIVRCPSCDSTALRLVKHYADPDTYVIGALLGCQQCGRGYGLVLNDAEDANGNPVVTIALRLIGKGADVEESRS